MHDHGRFEARIVTLIAVVVGGLCVAAAASPTIELVLNVWLGLPVFAAVGLWLLVRVFRSVWLTLSIDRECARSLVENERAVREVHRRA